jgi:hypothetical protein
MFINAGAVYVAAQDPVCRERETRLPFIEIEMDLVGQEAVFFPPLGSNADGTGLQNRIHAWIHKFYSVGALMVRVDGVEGSYCRDLEV